MKPSAVRSSQRCALGAALLQVAVAGCTESDATSGRPGPPASRVFVDEMGVWVDDPVAAVLAGDRVYFPIPAVHGYITCWRPDADSFDDFATGAPVGGPCEADGKPTGPDLFRDTHDPSDLLPSRWCRIRGCEDPSDGAIGG